MSDALDRVLKLVAEGRLTADEAGPILDALSARDARTMPGRASGSGSGASNRNRDERTGPRFARLEVREGGRRVVDLRIPISLGRLALNRVPGLSENQVSAVEQAVAAGSFGPILDIEDPDGDGVRIVLE